MKVSGVITEYNPFHNGHKYQLDKIREETHSDYIIVAMSGNFVQRGTPAFLDKYLRTEIALKCGADLVLEIPVIGATASAESFANAGVSILNSTGVVSYLCYGVEKKSDIISKIASFLRNPSSKFNEKLATYTKSGDSFPVARAKALCNFFPDEEKAAVEDILKTPNNILGIEYEKALKSTSISGHQIKRIGEDYHSTNLSSAFASASAIREAVFNDYSLSDIGKYVPKEMYEILKTSTSNFISCVKPDDISQLLYYKLMLGMQNSFDTFSDCTEELSSKICNNIYQFESFTQFSGLLKSKNYTLTRINRVLTHILLDIKKTDTLPENSAPYLRVLGFKKGSSALLHEIKEKASAPLITKVADASSQLSPHSYEIFKKDIFASDLYRSIAAKSDTSVINKSNEYTKGLIIIP